MAEEQQTEKQQQRAVTFADVCGGAMAQAFESSLRKCLANIMDLNTEARAKRKIHLTLTLAPKDDRVTINCILDSDEKLAGDLPVESRMFIGKDAEGNLYALHEDPRQMNIFTPPAPRALPDPIQFTVAAK